MTTTIAPISEAKALQQEIVDLRRQLHQIPELSFKEHETAKIVAEKLNKLGYEVKEGVGKTGITAEFGQGSIIGIRADMDALPIQETNDIPYKSKNDGVMHACGHDAHVSIALATAKLLKEKGIAGKARMLMQPAEEYGDEEGKSGAVRMIEDGALNDVKAVIGLHVDAGLKAGHVAILDGPVMAAVDGFTIKIKGKGGHGAYPETTVDAIVIGAQIVQAIQQIVSRRVSALEPAVVTIGSFKSSSSRGNVIAEEVHMEGTFRTFSESTRNVIRTELDKVLSISRSLGGDYELKYELGYPTTVNCPEIAEIMRGAAIDLIGEENVIKANPKTWSEDFSYMAQEAPGAFMFLGAEIEGDTRSHHSPDFNIDESGLYIGAAILTETAHRLFKHYESQ